MDISKIRTLTPGGMTADDVLQSTGQTQDDSFEKYLQNAVKKNDDKQLKSACQQFEGILLDMLYSDMQATVMKSDLMPDDPGTDIYQSMLDDDLMDQASKTDTFGLADSLYKQLSKQTGNDQDKQTGTTANDINGKKAAENKPVDK